MSECRSDEAFADTYTPLRPEQCDTSAMRQLACSVLKKAIDRATRGYEPARLWFEREDSNLPLWCDILELDTDMVRERVLSLPRKPPHAPKNRKRVHAGD
jgi:hypothetical protein